MIKELEGDNVMKIKYLGTGAAEGIPALYCHCEICSHARKNKGRNIRTRSQALIDNKLLIDFGPDTYMHSLQYDIELANIYHCLITHAHDDHLYVEDLKARRRSRANLFPGTPVLNVYGGKGVEAALNPQFDRYVTKDKSVLFHLIEPYQTYNIDIYKVIPLPAVHKSESPYVYVIIGDGKTILYGHDTDFFDKKTWDYLTDQCLVFDIVSLDCTEGKKHIDYVGHMNFERIKKTCKEMKNLGLLKPESKIVVNHISHNGGINYVEASEIADSLGYVVSYDGMEIE